MTVRPLVFAFFVFSLTGCIVWPETFYKPELSGGHLYKSKGRNCGGSNAKLVYLLDNELVEFRVYAKKLDGGSQLDVMIIPKEFPGRVKFDFGAVKVTSGGALIDHRSSFHRIISSGRNDDFLMSWNDLGNDDFISIHLNFNAGKEFSVEWPTLNLGDVTFDVPTIRYKEDTSLAFYPLNCG